MLCLLRSLFFSISKCNVGKLPCYSRSQRKKIRHLLYIYKNYLIPFPWIAQYLAIIRIASTLWYSNVMCRLHLHTKHCLKQDEEQIFTRPGVKTKQSKRFHAQFKLCHRLLSAVDTELLHHALALKKANHHMEWQPSQWVRQADLFKGGLTSGFSSGSYWFLLDLWRSWAIHCPLFRSKAWPS